MKSLERKSLLLAVYGSMLAVTALSSAAARLASHEALHHLLAATNVNVSSLSEPGCIAKSVSPDQWQSVARFFMYADVIGFAAQLVVALVIGTLLFRYLSRSTEETR